MTSFSNTLLAHIAYNARWNTGNNLIVRHISSDYGACSYQGLLANSDARHNSGVTPNRCPPLDPCLNYGPVSVHLQYSAIVNCAGIRIVCEHYAVADKDFVFDSDTFADKSVGRDFAPRTYYGVLLNLDKCPYLRLRFDRATVEIDQLRLEDLHVLT